MELVVVLDGVPAIVVLSVGLVVLIRRRVALGRRGTVAIAAVAVLLAGDLAGMLLDWYVYRTLLAGHLGLPWWFEVADLMVFPIGLVGLPLLAWAVLAGRSPRPMAVTS
jgi:hypothetical protein